MLNTSRLGKRRLSSSSAASAAPSSSATSASSGFPSSASCGGGCGGGRAQLVGRTFVKRFVGYGKWKCRLIAYNADDETWTGRYSDGTEEKYSRAQLEKFLGLKIPAATAPAAAAATQHCNRVHSHRLGTAFLLPGCRLPQGVIAVAAASPVAAKKRKTKGNNTSRKTTTAKKPRKKVKRKTSRKTARSYASYHFLGQSEPPPMGGDATKLGTRHVGDAADDLEGAAAINDGHRKLPPRALAGLSLFRDDYRDLLASAIARGAFAVTPLPSVSSAPGASVSAAVAAVTGAEYF